MTAPAAALLGKGRSLTYRVTLAVVALVAAVCVLLSVATTSVVAQHLTDRLDDDLAGAHMRAVRALDRAPFAEWDSLLAPPSGSRPPDIREARGQQAGTVTAHFVVAADGTVADGLGQVIDADGQLEALAPPALDALAAAGDRPGTASTLSLPGLGEHRVVRSELDVTGSSVQVLVVTALPTSEVDATVSSLVRWSAVLGTVATVLSGAVATVVVRRQLRPLREVASTAMTLTETDLSSGEVDLPRVPPRLLRGGTEVAQVAQALDAALDHVDGALEARHRSEQQVRQFVADASHELRTPLATVRGYADLALRPDADDELRIRSLGKVRTEAERMGGLVEDLLLLARLDQGRPLEDVEVDLTMMVLEGVTDARITAPGHRWAMDLPDEPVTARGDEARLRQVLANLLANASRHTPEGTAVSTAVAREDDRVVVTVTDDGPGIAPDLLDDVFTRFTRGDSARTRAASGAGLGLSLARSIARAHGGDLAVTSRPGRTSFRLTLPSR